MSETHPLSPGTSIPPKWAEFTWWCDACKCGWSEASHPHRDFGPQNCRNCFAPLEEVQQPLMPVSEHEKAMREAERVAWRLGEQYRDVRAALDAALSGENQ